MIVSCSLLMTEEATRSLQVQYCVCLAVFNVNMSPKAVRDATGIVYNASRSYRDAMDDGSVAAGECSDTVVIARCRGP